MRHFFENIKTIVAEIIGIIGGFFWGRNSSWDYEPVILLVISISGLLLSIILSFLKSKDSNNSFTNENQDLVVSKITPEGIKEEIQNVPPFQQESIAQNYIGIDITWDLVLTNVNKKASNSISVVMNPLNQLYPNIWFETDTEKHPILKIAKKESLFKVEGKIVDCSWSDITLELSHLTEH